MGVRFGGIFANHVTGWSWPVAGIDEIGLSGR
jgi:hypothetical protein